MRKIGVGLVLCVVFGLLISPGTPQEHFTGEGTRQGMTTAGEGQEPNAEIIVYVTNTGKKYHRGTCRYLKKSKIPISLEDAKRQGYGPCSVCKPPT